jgi:chitinase
VRFSPKGDLKMRQCRLLALLGLIVVVSLAAPVAQAQTCAPAWSATQVYTAGNTASQNGINYRANWWTQGQSPATNSGGAGSGQPWTNIGTCGGGGDTTAPTTAISSPAAGATVSGTITVSATASDNVGVSRVELLVDGTVRVTDTTSPYSFSWNTTTVANGTRSLQTRAFDAAGNSGTSAARSVTVSNTGGGTCTTVPPTPGGLTSPSKTNNSVQLDWNDVTPGANCTIQYRVFRNNSLIATIGSSSYNATSLSASTTYTFGVEATSQAGTSGRASLSVTTNADPPPPPPGGQKLLGYFVQWGVYQRNYHVKNIVTSGSASKLTHINYAFGNVSNGQCVIGDSYADYDRFYSAAESVDGIADTWDTGALRGSFGQLRRLKRLYPNLRILFSFGGWTWSGGFAQAAANPTAFANSCYNLVEDPRWADVFDGIDIDWEYPNACGLSCDSSGFGSFRTLMSALRTRFGSNNLVTAAITADAGAGGKIDLADYAGAAQYVNWYNVMTYDFFGTWAASGPTAPHSPLTSYPGIPIAHFNSDAAIQKLKSKGIAGSKLLLGIGFYGRGWTGVSQSAPGGSAGGAAPGTFEAGNEDYKVLVSRCPANGTVGGTAYCFSGGQWWGYDTPSTIAGKMTYRRNQGLGGAFFWELNGDTTNGSLITAIYNNR